MVGQRRAAVILLAATLLAGCDLLSTPFPGFLSGLEKTVSVDVDPILNAGRTANGVRYDLEVIGTGADRRLLLLVEPPNSDPSIFSYEGRMLVMDLEMQEEIRLESGSPIDYLSRPFGYGHDGSLLLGYSIYATPLGSSLPDQSLDPPPGLEGFVTVDAAFTRHFALPSGRFSAFHLEMRTYNLPVPTWALEAAAQTIEIVPDGLALTEEATNAQLGFQLLGIAREGTKIRFLLSRPSEQEVIGVEAELAAVMDKDLSPRPVLLPDAAARMFTIAADRPQASVDNDGFFLLRRDGWFERYDWNGYLTARVTGDTSFQRQYAFDFEGGRFYRYDPASATLSRISGWW
jgi:hypothetical protein